MLLVVSIKHPIVFILTIYTEALNSNISRPHTVIEIYNGFGIYLMSLS